jgi:hypothetical protein
LVVFNFTDCVCEVFKYFMKPKIRCRFNFIISKRGLRNPSCTLYSRSVSLFLYVYSIFKSILQYCFRQIMHYFNYNKHNFVKFLIIKIVL